MAKVLKIRFGGEELAAPPTAVDPETLMEIALGLGFEAIDLDWAGMFQVQLPVEDDVMFLAEAANELEGVGTAGRHEVFLGDGLLQVETDLDHGRANMRVVYTPHLDKRFSEEATKECEHDWYCAAWRGLLGQLQRQLEGAAMT